MKKKIGVFIWGGTLILTLLFVVVGITLTFVFCTASEGVMTCPGNNVADTMYYILKDLGTVIGVLGAGAGLAWSNFYRE